MLRVYDQITGWLRAEERRLRRRPTDSCFVQTRGAAGEGGFFVEIRERALEPSREVGLGLPSQQALGFTGVRAAPGRVVDRQRFPLDQSDWR
jgi:hypothetical protein